MALAVGLIGLSAPARAEAPPAEFVTTWDTTKTATGSSDSTTIELPLVSGGTFDFTVDWGDETTSVIKSATDASRAHTYTEPGLKTVTITGTIQGWAFKGAGDRTKLLNVSSWGPLQLGNSGGYFQGASNLTITASDSPVLTGTSDMSQAFMGATSLTGGVAHWNVSGVNRMRSMFDGASSFNDDLSGWSVGNVTTFASMFRGASQFNADISLWNVASATNVASMFRGATAFERGLGSWDIRRVTDMTDMFRDVALDLATYDNLLLGWSAKAVEPGVDFSAGQTYYNPTTAGIARNRLTTALAWNITDLGPADVPTQPLDARATAASESAIVEWKQPASANNAPILSYEVTSSPGDKTCVVDAPALTCTVEGLANETLYTFTVTARNAVGPSLASANTKYVTPKTTYPYAPAKPFASPQDATTVRVYVSRSNAGGVPTDFEVTNTVTGTTCAIEVPAYYCDFTGLDGSTSYTFTATASNEFGQSPNPSLASDPVKPQTPIRMKWDTTLTTDGTSNNHTITLPLVSDGEYDFVVDWGDGMWGKVTSAGDGDRSHGYLTGGEKIITMTGKFRGFRFNSEGDRTKLLDVMNWSGLRLATPRGQGAYFRGASNLQTFSATDAPDTTGLTSLDNAFERAGNFNGPLDNWDVSGVTSMSYMFYEASTFNQNLNSWNTSNVTSMDWMFYSARAFDGAIGNWDTSKVTNMGWMFHTAQAFNQPLVRDGNKWNTGSVTSFAYMFESAAKFNQDLSSWNTASATNMTGMFNNMAAFNGSVAGFDTSKVTTMSAMFRNSPLFNQPLTTFNTVSVTNMSQMFFNARAFNQAIGGWDTGKVTTFNSMFSGATAFNQDINTWTMSSATDLTYMFWGATAFNQPLNAWNTSKVSTFIGMFRDAKAFNQPIGDWNTAKATGMGQMFYGAEAFNQPLRTVGDKWNTTNATDMENMFNSAKAFDQDVRTWDIGGVTQMTDMFTGSALSTRNYDKLLVSWAYGYATDAVANGQGTGVAQPGVTFSAGSTKYSAGLPAQARAVLKDGRGWTITDGGETATPGYTDPPQTQVPAIPAAPIALERTESAKVGWITPPTTGGDPLSYLITASPGGATCTITLPTDKTCLITGLTNAQSYAFTAVARNDIGASDPSAASDPVTPGESFQTTWRTYNTGEGTTNDKTVKLPLTATGSYNFLVRWGDGTSTQVTSAAEGTHVYAARGDYDITITGTLTGWRFAGANGDDRIKLLEVNRWGPLRLGNEGGYFQNASNMVVNATDALDLTGTTNLSSAFSGATKFNGPIGNWNTSQITDMSQMFNAATSFNQDLNRWDTRKVTTMRNMFASASSFNSPIDKWDTGAVTDMYFMFYNTATFNQPIGNWDTSKVTNMGYMFFVARAFNQSLNGWDTSSVTSMDSMFYAAYEFNGAIGNWKTGNVTNMFRMFGYTAFNQPIGVWNTAKVTNMREMFRNSPFNQPIGKWVTASVTDMSYMFFEATAFNQPIDTEADYGRWVTSSVTSMNAMFYGAKAFNQDLNSWDTSEVTGTGMRAMFYGASAFNGAIGNWDVSQITDFYEFLRDAKPFNRDLSQWNTSKVTDFGYMFYGTSFRGDVSKWDVTSATDMRWMFWNITPAENLRGLRSTPWYNRMLIAWSKQDVKQSVNLYLQDTGYTNASSFPKYSVKRDGAPDTEAQLARATLTGSGVGQKRWNIIDQGTTQVDAPGMPTNVQFTRSGANGNGDSATLTWERPVTGDLIADITYYVKSTRDPVAFHCETSALTCDVKGLPVNDRATSFHQFTVTASNDIGDSEPTTPIPAVKTPDIQAPALGTPTATEFGYTVQITNYTDAYDWEGSATQGKVTISPTGLVTVGTVARPVLPDTRSTVTVISGKFGYADQSASVTARALKEKWVPDLAPAVRGVQGWTAEILNDNPDFTWEASTGAGPGSAAIVSTDGKKYLRVTGLVDGQQTIATVTTTQVGYADGSKPVTASALNAALDPTYVNVTRTSDGFTAEIPNYDATYTWTDPVETAGTAVIEVVEGKATLKVTSVPADTESTVTLATTKTGHRDGQSQTTGRSLKAALAFTLGTPVSTKDGFTVAITGFDGTFDWAATTDPATSAVVNAGTVTVSGLDPDVTAKLTVTASKDGYTSSTTSVDGASLKPALVPVISDPVATPDGFTAVISNYNGTDYTWGKSTTDGSVNITSFDDGGVTKYRVVVTGLNPADPATVTLTTTRAGYAQGRREFTAASLKAKLDPTFGTVTRTDGGFTVPIANYDGADYNPTDYEWFASVDGGGKATIAADTGVVTVTGLADGQEVTLTVANTRKGFAPGTGTTKGRALFTELTVTLGTVQREDGGFSVPVTNVETGYTWSASTTKGMAKIVEADGTRTAVVTGLVDGESATMTVVAKRDGYIDGSTTQVGTALDAALDPTFGEPEATDGGFTVAITNYDGLDYDPADYLWTKTSTKGNISLDEATGVITVSDLPADTDAVVTVTTTRAGHLSGSATVTGSSQRTAVHPLFGQVTRTDGGFEVEITNYDTATHDPSDFVWTATTNGGVGVTAEIARLTGIVTVSGLADGQTVTLTVTTTRKGYFQGSSSVPGQALDTELDPDFGTVTRTAGGFTVPITNFDGETYDPNDYTWKATTDGGDKVLASLGASGLVTVTGLNDGQKVTLSVTTTRAGYLDGTASIDGTALNAPLTPTFGTPAAIDGGFTVAITNYDGETYDPADYVWDVTSDKGQPTLDEITGQITVSDLQVGESSQVTVTTTRDEHRDGLATVTGTALRSALTPAFGTVERVEGGFRAAITNYDTDYVWSWEATAGEVDIVKQTVDNVDTWALTVTKLADGEEATVRVTTYREGYFLGTNTLTNSALDAAFVPAFDTAVPGDKSFTVKVNNYQPGFAWELSATAGTAVFDANTKLMTVSGLTNGQSSTVTVKTTRTGYLPGESTATGAALKTAVDPAFGDVKRTDGGFEAPITNYSTDFTWTPSAAPGSATIDANGLVTVTGLTDGQESTLTVSTADKLTPATYFPGTNTITGNALDTALVPQFETAVAGEKLFTVKVKNYNADYEWQVSATAGTAVLDKNTAIITVTGLSNGESSTVTVKTTRTGYLNGQDSTSGMALKTAQTPEFGDITRTPSGFTAPITNYSVAFTWTAISTPGAAEVIEDPANAGTYIVKVTGLAVSEKATATVTAKQDGYLTGSADISGRAELAPLTPTFGLVERLEGGFRAEITNYDPDYAWSKQTTAGEADIVKETDKWFLTVTGLADGELATVTVTSNTGGVQESAELTSNALGAALVPEFDTAVPGDKSFTVKVKNFDADFDWEASATPGTAVLDENTAVITVSGLSNGQSSTVTVKTSRDGYLPGEDTVTGAALNTAVTPAFGNVKRTGGGFEVSITNYDGETYDPADFDWTAGTDGGGAAVIDPKTGLVTVTGLTDGQEVILTVTATDKLTPATYFPGSNTIRGRALDTELVPQFEAAVPGDKSFTVKVKYFDADFDWEVSETEGTAVLDENTAVITVSGLTNGQSSTVTVKTTRPGYLDGQGTASGTALETARTPQFGSVTRTTDGFTAPITNHDPAFTWTPTATPGTATVIEDPANAGTYIVKVTGLAPSQRSAVTVVTTRAGWFDGTAQVSGRAVLGELGPTFGPVERVKGGFRAEITNYDSDYDWTSSTTLGKADIVKETDKWFVTVTGLDDGDDATATVTSDTGTLQKSADLSSSALDAALVPDLEAAVPGDKSFTVKVTNFSADYDWAVSASPGTAVLDENTAVITVSGLTNGQSSTVTVETTREGYLDGESTATGAALKTAVTPAFGEVNRTDGGFEVLVTNYVAGFDWTASATPGTASIDAKGLVTVTGLTDGQESTLTVSTADKVIPPTYFPGSNTITATALETELVPDLGQPVPGRASFTVPILNYNADYTWSARPTAGSGSVVTDQGTAFVKVTGLDPEQSAAVTVKAARSGHIDGINAVTGVADTGGQLDPVLTNVTPTADGLEATISNYDPNFTWMAESTVGVAEVVVSGPARLVRVTGVQPDTGVAATVSTTRPKYDTGSATVQVRTLKAAFEPAFSTVTRLDGGFSTELARYSSRYTWTVESSAGQARISSEGIITVTGLPAGESAKLWVRTSREGHAVGVGQTEQRSLDPSLTPQFAEVVGVDRGVTARVSNYSPDWSWRATSDVGSVVIDGNGRVSVSGLGSGQGVVVTVISERSGFRAGTASFQVNALNDRSSVPVAAAPNAPVLKKARLTRKGRVEITWAARGDGGLPILSARATCESKDGPTRRTTGRDDVLTVPSLRKRTKYSCTVQVRNQLGWSDESEAEAVRRK